MSLLEPHKARDLSLSLGSLLEPQCPEQCLLAHSKFSVVSFKKFYAMNLYHEYVIILQYNIEFVVIKLLDDQVLGIFLLKQHV